jgi:uncharacterized protein DUF6958
MPKPRRLAAALVQLRNPDRTRKMPRMPKQSYDAARRTALALLPKKAPGITLDEFLDRMTRHLPRAKGWDRSASASWYAMAIKLDLEARGEIKRINAVPPQRLVRS